MPHAPHPLGARLHDLLYCGTLTARTIRVRKHYHVYTSGDRDEQLYYIERGRIKLVMSSLAGKACLLAIHTQGDFFGESCMTGTGERPETAVAMEDTILKSVNYRRFLTSLRADALSEEIVRYLATRLAEQQQSIADLVTTDSEYRLGKTLLLLGYKLGKRVSVNIRIEHHISHEELSQIVGTTRPRVSEFLQKFRSLGLIEISAERFLIIKEKQLTDYLKRSV